MIDSLTKSLSIERLNSYYILCPSKSLNDIIGAYHWNLLVSRELYPFIHSAEVALRNAIHCAASEKFQNERWFDIAVTDKKSKSIITKLKEELITKKFTAIPSDIVANLNFGFWVYLLKFKDYSDKTNPNKLWPDLIPNVFPNFQRQDDERKNLADRFYEINLLRNRLFHQEPIWKFKKANSPEESIIELRKKFKDIFKAIG